MLAGMRKRIGALALLALGAVGQTPAEAACTCRGRNVVAREGQTVCLSTPWGARLARCEKAQNVTTWRFLEAPCPLAQGSGTGGSAARKG
jgi:hypothetical protein